MKVLFVNEGSLDTVSGGYIYNKKIINYGVSKNIDITYSDKIEKSNYDLIIVDSLYLNNSHIDYDSIFKKTIFLIHQLPNSILKLDGKQLSFAEKNHFRYIVTGQKAKDDLIIEWKITPDNITVIEPGINKGWKSKSKHSKQIKKLILAANYVPNKGYEYLPELIEKLQQHSWSLACYGNQHLNSPFYYKLKQSIEEIDQSNRIVLHDSISNDELNDRMLDSDLMLSLSTSETYGMAISEALHTNLPVLIFKTGNWKTFQKNSLSVVVENKNIKVFTKTLDRLLSKSNPFTMINGQTKMRSWDIVGNEFFNFCRKLCSDNSN